LNVIALVKNQVERYLFFYDDSSLGKLLQHFGECAADKELSFTWYDAAVLSQKVVQLDKGDVQ